MGMSSPSIHTIGSLLSLPWSCQVQDGVMTKSPGDMIVLLAIDRGVGAVAFDDEAQRRLRGGAQAPPRPEG